MSAGKGIDDAAIARFAKMGMEGLAFDGTGITDAGLAAFKDAKLTKLSLSHALALKGNAARWRSPGASDVEGSFHRRHGLW